MLFLARWFRAGCIALLPAVLPAQPSPPNPHSYWQDSRAEIAAYTLHQGRYSEVHRGEAVLITVREPFSRSKQVKLDDWQGAGDDRINVLKLNHIRRFNTGIYPYSLMLSIFVPAGSAPLEPALKVTASAQEWCGQIFTQLNRRADGWHHTSHSYFESEGDRSGRFEPAPLEDELWTHIRLAPDRLPTGVIRMVPGTLFTRLTHRPLQPEEAAAEWIDPPAGAPDAPNLRGYRIRYRTGGDRELTLWIQRTPPHGIVGWEETYTDVAGKRLTSRATRTAVRRIDYWNRNRNADRALRTELGLPADY